MSQTLLTVYPGSGTTPLLFTNFVFTAADVSNGNAVSSPTGDEVIVAWNTDSGNSHYATLIGVSGAESIVIPANGFSFIGRVPLSGFLQPDGSYHLSVDSALVKFAVLIVPS